VTVGRDNGGRGKESDTASRHDAFEDAEDTPTRIFELIPDESKALVPAGRVRLFEPSSRSSLPPGLATNEQLDAFRDLRTRLLLKASDKGLEHFTTLVVPITPGSGASFVSRNLAATFTLQEGIAALLVDCDFRSPGQREVFPTPVELDGLSEYLEWGAHRADKQAVQMRRLVQPTQISGLHLIPAGRCEAVRAGRPREYFSSTAMRELMERLRAEPCFVFLDGPPIAGSPDARILSELADLVILVVGYAQNTTAAITEAARLFERAKFAGVVFNERAGSFLPRR
jgi:Mrp family chromosome partitioning ATPase